MQQTSKTVNVSVYKRNLGYWYKNDFRVGPGQMIGSIVKLEVDESDEDTIDTSSQFIEPESIDYRTGATMVDLVLAEGLSGTDTPGTKPNYDMLYRYAGSDTKHMYVTSNSSYFTDELRDIYKMLQREIKKEKEPLKAWDESGISIQKMRQGQYRRRIRRI